MDNLNTHIGASLYKIFNPKEARRILDKLDFHYTPIHGSWLNMAEIEFSILGRECLERRIPDKTALINEVNAWTEERNSKESKIIWRFKNEDARIKLKRLYPLIKKYLIKIDDVLPTFHLFRTPATVQRAANCLWKMYPSLSQSKLFLKKFY